MTELFKVLRRSEGDRVSLIINSAMPEGALVGSDTDPAVGKAATNLNFSGFLTRAVTANGPTLTDFTEARTDDLELPAKVGTAVTADPHVTEFEVEGADYLQLTGTGDLTAAVAEQSCEINAGKIRGTQTGGIARFVILEVMTPVAGGAKRFRMAKIHR